MLKHHKCFTPLIVNIQFCLLKRSFRTALFLVGGEMLKKQRNVVTLLITLSFYANCVNKPMEEMEIDAMGFLNKMKDCLRLFLFFIKTFDILIYYIYFCT